MANNIQKDFFMGPAGPLMGLGLVGLFVPINKKQCAADGAADDAAGHASGLLFGRSLATKKSLRIGNRQSSYPIEFNTERARMFFINDDVKKIFSALIQ